MKEKIEGNRPSEVIYQVYPASFCDANGDGHGDLKGITSKLEYIKSLNVDAIWISPIFMSPEGEAGDGGYAISDYRKINPKFGTEDDFRELVDTAHRLGMRVYTDFVMCHTSDQHEWFKKSCEGDPEFKDFYVWEDQPNNWKSVFTDPKTGDSKSAWTFNEQRGQYFMHHFNESQPALNLNNPKVQEKIIDEEMDYWLGRMKVDGLRLDALPYANHSEERNERGHLRDNPWMRHGGYNRNWNEQYMQYSMCQPETVQLVERIRKKLDSYPTPKRAIGEVIAGREGGGNSLPVAAEYLDPEKGLHTCYTEGLIKFWFRYPTAHEMRDFIDQNMVHSPDGGFCNNASNHDFPRTATRMTEGVPQEMKGSIIRQLMALHVALPGSFCMYQGEELGLPQARIPEDIPPEKVQDRVVALKDCRDGARTPMPWNARAKNAGFSEAEADQLYLPIAAGHPARAVSTQEQEKDSMLNFTRQLLKERQENQVLQTGATRLLETPEPILAFVRETDDQAALFVFNMGRTRQQFRPANYLDPETLKKIQMHDAPIELGPYDYTRYGLKNIEHEHSQATVIPANNANGNGKHHGENGHAHKKIFALDYLVGTHVLNESDVPSLVSEYNIQAGHKYFLDDEKRHKRLLQSKDKHHITLGGHTNVVLATAKEMLGPHLGVAVYGLTGSDAVGQFVQQELRDYGIELPVKQWPDSVIPETVVSHAIHFNDGRNALLTHSARNAEGVNRLVNTEEGRKLLEQCVAESDVVYLPGSLTKKFGRQMTERLTGLRWDMNKEMILSLPVHADFGPDDADQIKYLIPSANAIIGSDTEFCRLLGLNTDRPISQADMDKVTGYIQHAFSQHVLQENGKPCSKEQVALITRGDGPALLVTEHGVTPVEAMDTGTGKSKFGVGDMATAGFIAGYLTPGVSHEQSAKLGMRMAGHKILQDSKVPTLDDARNTFETALKHSDLAESIEAFKFWDDTQHAASTTMSGKKVCTPGFKS